MISLALSISNERLRVVAPTMAAMIDSGRLSEVVAHGRNMLDRVKSQRPEEEAMVGQATIRALMVLGRDEEAEELMGRLLKTYDTLPRKSIRWHTAVDQAVFMLHMNRPARATQVIAEIADDPLAHADLRIEVLILLANAYVSLGRQESAFQALHVARELAEAAALPVMVTLVDLTRLGVEVSVRLRTADELSDHDHYTTNRQSSVQRRSDAELKRELDTARMRFGENSQVGQRAMQLLAMLAAGSGSMQWLSELQSSLAWIRTHSLHGLETPFRLEAALACLGACNATAASEFLKPLTFDEQKLVRHRFAVELEYCLSKLHAHQGRHSDALRYYKLYSCGALESLRHDTAIVRAPRCMAGASTQRSTDSLESRLPARYRRAYRYLMEHLARPELSVRQVAAQIGVTERALQLAFHKHLGMTPAEVIRMRRMEHIHAELSDADSEGGVLEVAARWGVTNRSTLAHRYRQMFSQTPTETRGVRASDDDPESETDQADTQRR
jgi:AraC-like DNA-binding protein